MAVGRSGGKGTYPSTRIQRIDGRRDAPEDVDFAGMGEPWGMILATCWPS